MGYTAVECVRMTEKLAGSRSKFPSVSASLRFYGKVVKTFEISLRFLPPQRSWDKAAVCFVRDSDRETEIIDPKRTTLNLNAR